MVEEAFSASPIHNSQWPEPLVGLLEKIDSILELNLPEIDKKTFEEPLKIIARIDVLLARIEEDEIEYGDDALERTMLIDDNGSEGVASGEAESVQNEFFLRSFNATSTLEISEAQVGDDPQGQVRPEEPSIKQPHEGLVRRAAGKEASTVRQGADCVVIFVAARHEKADHSVHDCGDEQKDERAEGVPVQKGQV